MGVGVAPHPPHSPLWLVPGKALRVMSEILVELQQLSLEVERKIATIFDDKDAKNENDAFKNVHS